MPGFLKGAAIAALLTGTALAATGIAGASDYNHRGDRGHAIISIGLGDIAFGYRDGYWDNSHHWHHWRHSSDYRSYRGQNGSNYHDWNHNRDRDHGWQGH